jgi:hypothetical protein
MRTLHPPPAAGEASTSASSSRTPLDAQYGFLYAVTVRAREGHDEGAQELELSALQSVLIFNGF